MPPVCDYFFIELLKVLSALFDAFAKVNVIGPRSSKTLESKCIDVHCYALACIGIWDVKRENTLISK